MYTRTLFLLAVAAVFGLSYGESFANPTHGTPHPKPKSQPPANKSGTANAKSTTPVNKSGANTATNPSSGATTKWQVTTSPQHDAHKDSIEHKKREWHKEKEFHEKERQRELARLATIEAELAQTIQLLQRQNHPHYAMKNNHANASNPYQSQNGQQQPYQSQQNGQQKPSSQQNASTGGQDSAQPQVAQEQQESPGSEPSRPGMANAAFQNAEQILLAAIHQLEQAFGMGGEHRQMAEARHLVDETARRLEVTASEMRHYEEPRLEATPKQRRS